MNQYVLSTGEIREIPAIQLMPAVFNHYKRIIDGTCTHCELTTFKKGDVPEEKHYGVGTLVRFYLWEESIYAIMENPTCEGNPPAARFIKPTDEDFMTALHRTIFPNVLVEAEV